MLFRSARGRSPLVLAVEVHLALLLSPPLAVALLEDLLQQAPVLDLVVLRARLTHFSMVRLAASARKSSSRWSSRYQRRPSCFTEGTRPRLTRIDSVVCLIPSTAAAAGAGSQSCSSSGGCGLRGRPWPAARD